jgi:hypothetical protein
MLKIWGLKMTKIDQKMTPYKFDQNWPKIDFHGGGSKCPKLTKIDLGGPGPQNHKFFEILHFSTKTFGKSTPINDPHKFKIPHKNACTRVKKSSKIGGPGADRSDRKM